MNNPNLLILWTAEGKEGGGGCKIVYKIVCKGEKSSIILFILL